MIFIEMERSRRSSAGFFFSASFVDYLKHFPVFPSLIQNSLSCRLITKQSVLLSLFVLTTISVASLRAQSPLEADAVAYRSSDPAKAQVELYYGVIERALAFKQSGSNWSALITAKGEIWQNGKVIESKDIRDTVRHTGSKSDVEALGANKGCLGAVTFKIPYEAQTIAFLWQRGMKDGKPTYDTIAIPLTLGDRNVSHIALRKMNSAHLLTKLLRQQYLIKRALCSCPIRRRSLVRTTRIYIIIQRSIFQHRDKTRLRRSKLSPVLSMQLAKRSSQARRRRN